MKTLYMETTQITVGKTVAEIQEYLAAAGARLIMIEYGKDREPSSIKFTLDICGSAFPFLLPARFDPIRLHLNKKRPPNTRAKFMDRDAEQAQRVAWRQILRWVQAQFALIDTGMVEAQEVFLPYLLSPSNETFYEALKARNFKGLLSEGGRNE